MKQTQKHSLTDIVTVKSGKFIRYVVVAAMMAVAAAGGINAKQIKVLDYKTGETFYIDDSEKDKYACSYSFDMDELGFTYEMDCRYAEIIEYDDGDNVVSIIPIGASTGAGYIFRCGTGRTMDELKYNTGTKYKSVKHTILESNFIELNETKLIPKSYRCSGCGRRFDISPFEGYEPAEIVDYYYTYVGGHRTDMVTSALTRCNMLQYNYEEQIVRLYAHQKIRFDYSTDKYEEEIIKPDPQDPRATLLDLRSGEIIKIESEELDNYKSHYDVTYDETGFMVEYKSDYVMLRPESDVSEVGPVRHYDYMDQNGFRFPILNINPIAPWEPEDPEYKGMKYTVITAEYFEMSPYELGPSPSHCHGCGRNYDIVPYDGFAPEIVSTSIKEKYLPASSYVTEPAYCALMQYNYNDKKMRIYKNLKIRFDYTLDPCFEEQSGVAEVEAGGGEAQYFNLQGMRVAQPRAGQLYIERRGNSGRLLFK